MKMIFSTLLVLILVNTAFSQNLQVSSIEKLADEVNSASNESQPMLTPKGDTLYFIRSSHEENTGGPYSGQDIWYSVKTDDNWSTAKNSLKNLNSADNNAIIGINTTGDHMYLINSYSPPVRRNRGVVYATKDKGTWSTPREIDLTLNIEGDFYGFYMHPKEDVLIISMESKGSVGQEDLYVSLKQDDQWSKPMHLGSVINSEGYEISPFLSSGKDSLFFASSGHAGLGDADIFMSTKLNDDWQQWSVPVNVGEPINSEAFDAYYFQHGNQVYFSSGRSGNEDIYVATFDQEQKAEEKTEEISQEAIDEVEVANEELTQEEGSEKNGEQEEVAETIIEDKERTSQEKPVETNEVFTEKHQVHFSFDDHQLNKENVKTLNDLAVKIKNQGASGIIVVVTGYTDSVGPGNYNKALSEKRAKEVASHLKTAGIESSIIQTSGKGEEEPVATNETPEGRAMNRRVEVVIEDKPK